MSELRKLNECRMALFRAYEKGNLSEEAYLRKIKPVDDMVAALEMACLTGRHPSETEVPPQKEIERICRDLTRGI